MMHGTESYEVICSNLAYALKMEDAAHALKQAQLAEMAVMMAKATEDKEDGDEQRRVWNEALSVLPESCDRVDLANRYYDALWAKPKNDLYFLDQDEVRSVSYLRNRGSDGAYDYFTSTRAHVRAVYVSGHEDALENCYDSMRTPVFFRILTQSAVCTPVFD